MALGKQIRKHRKARGWTLEELSERSGVEGGTIGALEARDSKKSEFAQKLAGAFGLTIEELESTDPDNLAYGTSHSTKLTAAEGGENYASNVEAAPKLGFARKIPVVGTAQLGDNGFWAEWESPVGFGDGYVLAHVSDSGAYALRCKGDSMRPRIKDGEFVIAEPALPYTPGDEVIVKSKDGRVMVKEFLFNRDGSVHLLSVNESHGKIVISVQEIEFMHLVTDIAKRLKWKPD